MSRRVVEGKYADGVNYGLKVSLPGRDAFTADSNDPAQISFDSNWTDIAKIHQVGIVRVIYNNGFTDVAFPDLGYIPFAEARRIIGDTVYDDWVFAGRAGVSTHNETNRIRFGSASGFDYSVLYMVFAIPVPSQ